MAKIETSSAEDVKMRPFPDLPAEATAVFDIFGEVDEAPFDFGIWDMYPIDEPVEFSYAAESMCAMVVSGVLTGRTRDGTRIRLGPGDSVFIKQSDDAQIEWQAEGGPCRTVFAAHPYYPRL